MTNTIKILVVEDEMIIAAKIAMKLEKLGYEVSGILPRGEEAIINVRESEPDIILLDINLKGEIDGVETAKRIQENHDIAIIYITANNDEATFSRAKSTKPHAFLSKPINELELQRAIELTVERLSESEFELGNDEVVSSQTMMSNSLIDRIFVKHKEKMIKIFIKDILYLSADRSYCHIFTKTEQYTLSVPLKNVENKLSTDLFVRVHRSYLVNITQIDELEENHVFVGKKAIPLSQNLKDDLYKRLNRF